jgi:ABC-type nitrate/sulfonate/bicarbonate transport system substrate-binding protein
VSRLVALLLSAAVLGACGASGSHPASSQPVTLRLGHFANLTHATALVGLRKGIFAEALGPSVSLRTSVFGAGPEAVEALLSNSVDAAYVGPNPAVNAFVQSRGRGVRVVSGATSGGASLVVRPSIAAPADLRGRTLATPQLGNTQDVALRWWLAGRGLRTSPQGGGDVAILPQDNAQTLLAFRSGQIDGAWVPEPWATRLVLEAGGRQLVDERDLWAASSPPRSWSCGPTSCTTTARWWSACSEGRSGRTWSSTGSPPTLSGSRTTPSPRSPASGWPMPSSPAPGRGCASRTIPSRPASGRRPTTPNASGCSGESTSED